MVKHLSKLLLCNTTINSHLPVLLFPHAKFSKMPVNASNIVFVAVLEILIEYYTKNYI